MARSTITTLAKITMHNLGFLAFWVIILLAPFLALTMQVWEFWIRPLTFPRKAIEASARKLLINYGEYAEKRCQELQYSAWLRGDIVCQGKWRKVEKVLQSVVARELGRNPPPN